MFYYACRLYTQTLTRNELFHWLLINFMCVIADAEISPSQLDLIDKELLQNLLSSELFVISTEHKLYVFLKKWMLRDLERQNQLRFYDSSSKDSAFLTTMLGEQYHELFDYIRLPCLLAYSKKVPRLFQDNIISPDVLNKTLADLYTRILKASELSTQDNKNHFRFAKRITVNEDFNFTNDFFFAGVVLTFKFNSRRLAVERCAPNGLNALNIMYHGPCTTRMSFTLHGSSGRDQSRFTSENTTLSTMDLAFGKERTIHNWRKPVTFPCILSASLQILLGTQVIEVG
jgi:hypothetical protein